MRRAALFWCRLIAAVRDSEMIVCVPLSLKPIVALPYIAPPVRTDFMLRTRRNVTQPAAASEPSRWMLGAFRQGPTFLIAKIRRRTRRRLVALAALAVCRSRHDDGHAQPEWGRRSGAYVGPPRLSRRMPRRMQDARAHRQRALPPATRSYRHLAVPFFVEQQPRRPPSSVPSSHTT